MDKGCENHTFSEENRKKRTKTYNTIIDKGACFGENVDFFMFLKKTQFSI